MFGHSSFLLSPCFPPRVLYYFFFVYFPLTEFVRIDLCSFGFALPLFAPLIAPRILSDVTGLLITLLTTPNPGEFHPLKQFHSPSDILKCTIGDRAERILFL